MNEDNNNNFILVDEDKPKEKKLFINTIKENMKEMEKNSKNFISSCYCLFLCNEWLCFL